MKIKIARKGLKDFKRFWKDSEYDVLKAEVMTIIRI